MASHQSPPCSVLILTLNEAVDLPGCLASLDWCDDIHVLDSLSQDGTQEIARAAGASVSERPFDDYSAQRNFGLKELAFRHEWVLILDADERIPRELADELARTLLAGPPDDVVAYRLRRRDHFLGRWLRHVQASPWYIRLVRHQRCHYSPRIVNEVLVPEGEVAELSQPFDHFPFNKGIDYWFERHNRYSRMEAEQIVADRRARAGLSLRKAFFERDFHVRRRHQKELFLRLPCRPLIKFLILYIGKAGFLDGRPGLMYAQMQACYERMIILKTRELQVREYGDGQQTGAGN